MKDAATEEWLQWYSGADHMNEKFTWCFWWCANAVGHEQREGGWFPSPPPASHSALKEGEGVTAPKQSTH